MYFFIFIILVLIGFSFGIYWEYKTEKNDWNNGICLKTNKPWVLIKSTRDGLRLYSDESGNYTWTSFYFEVV